MVISVVIRLDVYLLLKIGVTLSKLREFVGILFNTDFIE